MFGRATQPAPAFHFVTAVWGQRFVGRFLDVTLPNQLLPGNLGAFDGADTIYRVFTSSDDEDRIRRSPAFGRLVSLMPAEVEILNASELAGHKWKAMSACHRRALQAAAEDRDAVVFLDAAIVLSDGSLAAVRRVAAQGKRLATIIPLPVLEDGFMREYEQRGFAGLDPVSAPTGRDLVSMSMRSMHPIIEALRWDSGGAPHYLPTMCFKVGENGLVARTIQPHPLMVRPHDRSVELRHTIDDDYILSVVRSPEEIHAFDDSDEFVMCTLEADREHGFPLELRPPSAMRYALWLAAQPRDRMPFLGTSYRYHAGDYGGEWAETHRRVEELVSKLRTRSRALRPATPLITRLRAARVSVRERVGRATSRWGRQGS